ncbi:hypothetical protein [Nitrosopumilus sp.]|uniref:hypothetical protein n=1 Tax=Nitrosopumilus sp. TaxID=2024843 RepID=UPI0024312345|nr:hypothetical protein [Nitrosopumilus sp.]
MLLFSTLSITTALAEENQKLEFDAPQIFSIKLPEGWDVERNEIFFESGWIASLYDNMEEWNVQIDISQQTTDLLFTNTKKQTIVENLFVSYYNICQNNKFDRKLFEDLPSEFHISLEKQFRQETSEGNIKNTNISEWWYDLSDNEIGMLFKDKQIENSDYLIGEMCSDFTPIDYHVIENEDFIRYQIFYTWKQTFPDDTYFENYAQINKLAITDLSKVHIITFDSQSPISQFEIHNESIEEVIDSLEILESKSLPSTEISVESRINMGLWANGQTPDSDFAYELEFLINSDIIEGPSILTNIDKIEITSIPNWLKTPTGIWYEQGISDLEYIRLLTNLLEREIIEFEIITR